MKNRLIALSIITSLFTFISFAVAKDGHELLKNCTIAEKIFIKNGVSLEKLNIPDAFSAGHCTGLVKGVGDTLKGLARANILNLQICIPNGVAPVEWISIVNNYLKTKPENLHIKDNILVLNAFKTAYKCP